jgi:hypothetical protein
MLLFEIYDVNSGWQSYYKDILKKYIPLVIVQSFLAARYHLRLVNIPGRRQDFFDFRGSAIKRRLL